MVNSALMSRYPYDRELPRDKKGRINIPYTFTPGEGKLPTAEGFEAE